MIELKTLQTVRMRNIHLFWCQRGNLEAVRVSPSPTPALTGTEPGYRHIHQHTFQEQISRNVGNTYKSHNQYCGHLNWTWGVSGAGKYFEREQSKCLFYLLAFLIPVVLKMWHLSPVADGGIRQKGFKTLLLLREPWRKKEKYFAHCVDKSVRHHIFFEAKHVGFTVQ